MTTMNATDMDMKTAASQPSKKNLKRKSAEQEARKSMYDSLKGMTNDELYNVVDDDGIT